jgi:type IV secretory pathway VirJ component
MATAQSRGSRTVFEGEVAGRRTLAGSPQRLGEQRRRGRRQGVSVALLLMLLGAAGAVYLASQGQARIDVVALAKPVQRGQIVTAADLATLQMSVDGGRARLATPALAATDIVGRSVLVDLPAGHVLTPELVASATPGEPGTVTVGVRVPADALPASTVRAGEWVSVVRTDSSTGNAQELVSRAMVVSSSSPRSDGSEETVVRLAVPAETADLVAGAASMNGGLRLLGVRP